MMVRNIIVGMLGLALVAFMAFRVEHQVSILQVELKEINRQYKVDMESIHTMEAEWAYLTRPERIRTLATKTLPLQPVTPAQLARC